MSAKTREVLVKQSLIDKYIECDQVFINQVVESPLWLFVAYAFCLFEHYVM